MPVCTCNFCNLARHVDDVCFSGTRDEQATLIRELHNLYEQTRADVNYSQAILDGSWPQAIQILTEKLENAKKLKELPECQPQNSQS